MTLLIPKIGLVFNEKIYRLFKRSRKKRNVILRDFKKQAKSMHEADSRFYHLNIQKYNPTTKQLEQSCEVIVEV